MDSNSRRFNLYSSDMDTNSRVTSPSTAIKLQDIRRQLEALIENARKKLPTNDVPQELDSPNDTFCSHSVNISNCKIDNSLLNNDPFTIKTPKTKKVIYPNTYGKLSLDEDNDRLAENYSFKNDTVISADAKLTAYKRFIQSLTRIIQDTNRIMPDSDAESFRSFQKRPVVEKGTFIKQTELSAVPCHAYATPSTERGQISPIVRYAEKTTYCRPVIYSRETLSKDAKKYTNLHQLVKKIVLAREKEKQTEAWNNYINELKNKHGYYNFQSKNILKLYDKDDETSDIIDDCYHIRHSWKQSKLCDHLFNDLYRASGIMRRENTTRRRTWCVPSLKCHKYDNNSFCCPISSQARLAIMKKKCGCNGHYNRLIGRYFKGSVIVAEKQLSQKNKSKKKSRRSSEIQDMDKQPPASYDFDQESDINTCKATQTMFKPGECYTKSKECQISEAKIKLEKISSYAMQQKIKKSRNNINQSSLFTVEQKLDVMIQSFNLFLEELKSKKIMDNAKSAAVSCSSMCEIDQIYKAKSDTYNSVLNKEHSVICEVAQIKKRSTLAFPPSPIRQDTIDDIINEEKDKSDNAKRDIENILSNTGQCAVEITIDIPTKEDYTEVTNSLYKTQEDTFVEEIEPAAKALKSSDNMTVAVNTDPLGILALIRISAETAKQILSYIPNLDYVTYLARRQLGSASPIARYICYICGSGFSRPTLLSDHIQRHNISNTK